MSPISGLITKLLIRLIFLIRNLKSMEFVVLKISSGAKVQRKKDHDRKEYIVYMFVW